MAAKMLVQRRAFAQTTMRALLGGVVVSFTSCRSRHPAEPTGPEDARGEIALNHGHEALITGVQLVAGGAIVLNIKGRASHNHTIELSASQIATLSAGGKVSVESSAEYEDKHGHTVTFG